MQLDKSKINNGEFVTGKLFIDEGRYLNLFLVDDEGIAININRFVNIGATTSTFKLQVNLTAGEVSTAQLFLAIVSDQLLDSTRSHEPVAAKQLLADIQAEISAKEIALDLALSAFEVNSH